MKYFDQFLSLSEKSLYGEQMVVQNKGLLGAQLADPQYFCAALYQHVFPSVMYVMPFLRDGPSSKIRLKSLGYALLSFLSTSTEHPNNISYVSMKLTFVLSQIYTDSFCCSLHKLSTVFIV